MFEFGGGVHSRAPADDIDIKECSEGENFDLDLQDTNWHPRKPFDLLGTAPNGQELRGFASLKKTNGDTSLLVQAGDTVYEWDGSTLVSRGTVDPNARLRGRLSHAWDLDSQVLITDLALLENVKVWDGATLSDVAFTDEVPAPFGPFSAKYCVIQNERAIFCNVLENGNKLPHILVGSKQSDYTQISVAQKPSSGLGQDDPFYMLTPDLRDINGAVLFYGIIAISTNEGSLFKVSGGSAQNFTYDGLYRDSAAFGDESLTYVGNDLHYGRQGRIESVASTDRFGDTEADDLSKDIKGDIAKFEDWTLVYNSRTQRVYCYPVGKSEVWVLYKPLIDADVSAWTKYTTRHAFGMKPSVMMNAYDPIDGKEYVYMGDADGNLYRMEGEGQGDAGADLIVSRRKLVVLSFPLDAQAFTICGWVRYRQIKPALITLRFIFQGKHQFEETISLSLDGASGVSYWGGGDHFGGGTYFGSNTKVFATEQFGVPGQSTEVQIELSIESKEEYSISEIGLRFEAVT